MLRLKRDALSGTPLPCPTDARSSSRSVMRAVSEKEFAELLDPVVGTICLTQQGDTRRRPSSGAPAHPPQRTFVPDRLASLPPPSGSSVGVFSETP
jgi:hypothetical protein